MDILKKWSSNHLWRASARDLEELGEFQHQFFEFELRPKHIQIILAVTLILNIQAIV